MAGYVNLGQKVMKSLFSYENRLFVRPFGGDKRDRTADLLNAIQALSRLERLHTPVNRAETALQYTGNSTPMHFLDFLLLLLVAPVNIGLLSIDRIRRSQNVISCAVYAKLRYC